MKSEEKIYKVLEKIKEKIDIYPAYTEIKYRAGREVEGLSVEEEVAILNKLEDEGIIEVIYNAGSEYI